MDVLFCFVFCSFLFLSFNNERFGLNEKGSCNYFNEKHSYVMLFSVGCISGKYSPTVWGFLSSSFLFGGMR